MQENLYEKFFSSTKVCKTYNFIKLFFLDLFRFGKRRNLHIYWKYFDKINNDLPFLLNLWYCFIGKVYLNCSKIYWQYWALKIFKRKRRNNVGYAKIKYPAIRSWVIDSVLYKICPRILLWNRVLAITYWLPKWRNYWI